MSGKSQVAAQLLSHLPRHRGKGNSRPAEVFGEVVVDEGANARLAVLVPEVVHDAAHLVFVSKQADHRAMILLPVPNIGVLTVLTHQLRNGVTCLRDALTLGQLGPNQNVESLIH